VASKSAQQEVEKAEVIEELLDVVDKTLDRVKVLYEQFFLGIQKQPPSHLHTDVERKLRDLQQMQIRNTALRYRFATIQQKFGSYNNYWRRTLRQIENGTYHRNLAKIGRQAAMTGEEIPEEILAAMPKRMREQVKRDREAALQRAKRRDQTVQDDEFLDEQDDLGTNPVDAKMIGGAHVLDDSDASFDLDAYFKSITSEDQTSPDVPASPPPRARDFEAEQATESDPIDPPTHRPQPVIPATQPLPVHPNPAVRAALGLRTPPAGVPAAPRVTPTAMNAVTPPVRPSQPSIPTQPLPTTRQSGAQPAIPATRQSGGQPAIPAQPMPPIPTQPLPAIPRQPPAAPSQVARPLPVMPGAARERGPVPVETLSGPFPREQPIATHVPANPNARTTPGMGPTKPAPPPPPGARTQPQAAPPRPQPPKVIRANTEPGVAAPAKMSPPPGMTDADVNALYAKYVKAKEAVGEKAGPGAYGKLLQTINAQAPKIMEQYKAKGVDFQVVVKDNQVVIRAKPKT
jgi:hypothetical protein